MTVPMQLLRVVTLFALVLIFVFQTGCSNDSPNLYLPISPSTSSVPDISQITEISSESAMIAASRGGVVSHRELSVIFPASVLPADSQLKASTVSISNNSQDSGFVDMTSSYVISATSSSQPLELADSATAELRINPAGFDPSSIQMVVWNGYKWREVPARYDAVRQVVYSTVEVILPYGTRIYSANPAKPSAK